MDKADPKVIAAPDWFERKTRKEILDEAIAELRKDLAEIRSILIGEKVK